MPNHYGHLIKRNSMLSGAKKSYFASDNAWLVQTRKNGSPAGSKAQIGETVFLYDVGYAVWAEGTIQEIKQPVSCFNIEELLAYTSPLSGKSNYKSTEFWGRIILEEAYPFFQKAVNQSFLSILEIQVSMRALAVPIPLPNNCMGQNSWIYLKQPIETLKISLELKPDIPTTLRRKIFDLCSLDPSEAYYDVDHFVPKSVGGPGNIAENLQPIGASINRKKSNEIPSALFDVAEELGALEVLKMKPKINKGLTYLSDVRSKEDAFKVTSYFNNRNIEEARGFYKEVRRRHRPAIDIILQMN